MRVLGFLPVFLTSMAVALLLAVVGVIQILSESGSMIAGILLLLAAASVSGMARTARANFLHQQRLNGMWHWAQGLGPQERQERRR